MSKHRPYRSYNWALVRSALIRLLTGTLLLLGLLAPGAPGLVSAQDPAAHPDPVQMFYVTLPEADGLTVLKRVNSAAVNPMYTYFSIAVAENGTWVYYDQWEDGYAADIANPSPSEIYNSVTNPGGVQIWGNGNKADGCAPNKSGVGFTCTDDNDVLNAGDVIVPYNAVPVPREPAAQKYVLDQFSSSNYGNNDGNTNWNGPWVEAGDGNGSATSGTIYITNNQLRFRYVQGNSVQGDSIYRGVDLSVGGACAMLSFTLGQSGIDANEDRLVLEVSSNGGANYTILDTYSSAAAAGNKGPYNISAYANASTRIRFRALDALESSTFGSAEYWSIDNVRIDWDCRLPILFDAGDKIAVSGPVAMARATWASGSSTLNAFAHEMYATNEWGIEYVSPVGTNTSNAGQMFEYSGLTIMACQNNTTVWIDADANGTYETTLTLQEGGSYLASSIRQGARVLADKPIQVTLLTGDIGSNYASRDMNLLPVSAWGSSYWSPVGARYSSNNTRLFIYNPGPGSIYVTAERYGVVDTTVGPVAAGATTTIDLIAGQGAHVYASLANGTPTDDKISVVGTIDTTGTAYDWSFTLYPDDFLTTEALIGLGLGRDPTYSNTGTLRNENGNPVWVTAACTGGTYVYVDWDNDGIADTVDTDGDGTAEVDSDKGIFVNYLQAVRLYKPGKDANPHDQTGARVWSRTQANMGDYDDTNAVPGCRLALAWGQDPEHATAAAPGLDVGTSVPPLRLQQSTKALVVVEDTEPHGVVNPGDVVVYNITIKNTGPASIQNVYVYDTVPENMIYVSDTTAYNVGDDWVGIPDDDDGDGFPLDVEGGVLIGEGEVLGPGKTWYARFNVEINAGDYDYEDIVNCDTVLTSAGSMYRCVTTQVATRDWGDLPDTYGTTAAKDGPRHSPDGLRLGTKWDYEVQGQPTLGANGDDSNYIGDEDGVESVASGQEWFDGEGKLRVTVTGGTGCLNAWMDFANDVGILSPDGNFVNLGVVGSDGLIVYDSYRPTGGEPYSEHIIQNMVLEPGTHVIDLEDIVPPGLNGDFTTAFYARFRLSPLVDGECQAVTPWGYVAGGEVEDYLFEMGAPTGVELESFTARGLDGAVQLRWVTVDESNVLGFKLWSARYPRGDKTQLNDGELISSLVAPGTLEGAVYSYRDSRLRSRTAYYYWLEVLDLNGSSEWHGPISAKTK